LNHIKQLDAISFITKVKLSKEMLAKLPACCLVAPILAFSHRKTYFAVGKWQYIHLGLLAIKTNNIKAYLPMARQGKADKKEDDENLDFDNQTASFTFNMSLPTGDCPPDILERDTEQQWQFLSEAIINWHQD
jgi:hypothetical protein